MRVSPFLLASLALALTACGGGTQSAATASAPASSPTTAAAVQPVVEPEPSPTATPQPIDFTIVVKVLKKSCFGSYGCNITYRIKPGYFGPDLTDDQEFEVVYKVTGGKDGPQINSFTMTGTEASFDSKEFLTVPSSTTKIKARVTEVLDG